MKDLVAMNKVQNGKYIQSLRNVKKVIKMYNCPMFQSIIDFKECQAQNKTQRFC